MIGDLLANRLQKSIRKNIGKARLEPVVVDNTLAEVKVCLLDADVHYEVVTQIIHQANRMASQSLVAAELKPAEMMIKIVYDAILATLDKNQSNTLALNQKLSTVMLVGLQGSGKTTTCAKLSHLIVKQRNKKVLLVAADPYRRGAVAQLQTLGAQLQTPVFALPEEKNPILIVQAAQKYALKKGYDVLLIDTAGRLQIAHELMDELTQMKKLLAPTEILLVVDGMVGQDLINQITVFHQNLSLTGVIVTKLDGDAKGGAALSVRYLTKLPIKFIGTGEQVKHLQRFYPERMANRIMGMGDLKTFFETVNDQLDARSLKVTMKRMLRGQFDLQDMLNQMEQIKKMGSLKSISRLLPSQNQLSDQKIANLERKLYQAKIMIHSMTNTERRKMRLLQQLSRKKRIITGSGRTEWEYQQMLSYYQKTHKQVQQVAKVIKKGGTPSWEQIQKLGQV